MKKRIIGFVIFLSGAIILSSESKLLGFVISSENNNNILSLGYFLGFFFMSLGLIILVSDSLTRRLREAKRGVPEGEYYVPIKMRYRNYDIDAYGGRDVISSGRTEHLPIHIHVKSPELPYELRIDMNTLKDLDGRKIPKDLRRYLEKNQLEAYRRAKNVYEKGKI
jgi:hypothetical protein